jgi:serine/threonine-protein phosphatase 5
MPSDKDAREKYQLTLKEYREREFAKCIQKDEVRITVNLDDIPVDASYTGPKLEKIEDLTSEWVVELMGYLKEGKVLHKKYAFMIMVKCREIFEKDKSLVHIQVPEDGEITVCGDVHG